MLDGLHGYRGWSGKRHINRHAIIDRFRHHLTSAVVGRQPHGSCAADLLTVRRRDTRKLPTTHLLRAHFCEGTLASKADKTKILIGWCPPPDVVVRTAREATGPGCRAGRAGRRAMQAAGAGLQ